MLALNLSPSRRDSPLPGRMRLPSDGFSRTGKHRTPLVHIVKMLFRAGLFATLSAALLACTPPPNVDVIERDPWVISLQAKGSCLARGNIAYDTTCLALLSFELVPVGGGDIVRRCYRFGPDERPSSIFSILQRGQFFAGILVGDGDYTIRIRGLHNEAAGLDPIVEATDAGIVDDCSGLELAIGDSRRWLMWGESKPIAVTDSTVDSGVIEVPVRIECRSCEGGCTALGEATCPAVFPPSFCAPSDTANTCERLCGPEQTCFDGEVICDVEEGETDGRCNPSLTGETKFCFPCTTGAECPTDYTCVGTQTRRFCSRPCPTQLCPSGAVCKRVGGDILTF